MFEYAKFPQILIATLATESSQEVTICQITKFHCMFMRGLRFYLHGLMQYDFQSQSVSQN